MAVLLLLLLIGNYVYAKIRIQRRRRRTIPDFTTNTLMHVHNARVRMEVEGERKIFFATGFFFLSLFMFCSMILTMRILREPVECVYSYVVILKSAYYYSYHNTRVRTLYLVV